MDKGGLPIRALKNQDKGHRHPSHEYTARAEFMEMVQIFRLAERTGTDVSERLGPKLGYRTIMSKQVRC